MLAHPRRRCRSLRRAGGHATSAAPDVPHVAGARVRCGSVRRAGGKRQRWWQEGTRTCEVQRGERGVALERRRQRSRTLGADV
eukprot:1194378-Prymnesium_polylepis.1